jgi:hypothetical protein
MYAYSRPWTLRDDPLNAFGGTADTRRFCGLTVSGGLPYNQTQDLCDETLHLGVVLQRPWAGCYADIGQVPHIGPGSDNFGAHESTWCWMWEDSYTCDVVVEKLLNENSGNLRNGQTKQDLMNSLGSIGCFPVSESTNGSWRTKTNCKFENPNGNYVHPSRPRVLGYDTTSFPSSIRFNVNYQAVCNVKSASFNGIQGTDTQSDYRYKPLCCSLNNVSEVTEVLGPNQEFQIDPITGARLSAQMCDETWCLDDPYGNCKQMFYSNCQGTSSCHRHNYLSTYNPVLYPQVDSEALMLLQILSVSGYSPEAQPFGGLACNAYYKKTKALSRAYPQLLGYDSSMTLIRVSEIQQQVSSYCNDPATQGNGECACLRGYQSLGAGFTPNTNLGAEETIGSTTYFSVPSAIKNFTHRVDIFCDLNGDAYSSFSGVLSYSNAVGETSCTVLTSPEDCITFSNACSSFTQPGVDQYPYLVPGLEKRYPSLNPNKSLLSSHNYGDAAANKSRNPFSIPYRCWLPACVDPQVTGLVFDDLLQNTPCPDICYAYAGSDAIDMTNVDANVISMGNFINQCNYDGNSSSVNVDPFALPVLLMNGFQFDVPQGYQGSLTFNVFNTELDVATVASSKTVNIFTDIPSYISVTQDVSLLYKYEYTSLPNATPGAHDSISVTLSVDATSQNPAYYQMNMYLKDSNLGSMRIPITLNIFSTISNPASESNWPKACAFYTDPQSNYQDSKCHAVDCFFGSNSVLTNAVKPPQCDGGIQGINFNDILRANTFLFSTSLLSTDGVPIVFRQVTTNKPVLNYADSPPLPLFNSTQITSLGFSELLSTHIQLFGDTLISAPTFSQNSNFNIVG